MKRRGKQKVLLPEKSERRVTVISRGRRLDGSAGALKTRLCAPQYSVRPLLRAS